MADFATAHALTTRNEGGYAHNPADAGGETLFGVSRKNFPQWAGWPIVDELKRHAGFPGTANANAQLQQLAHALYKTAFRNVLKLDGVTNQAVANAAYDFGVNAGTGRAAGFLQRAVNVTSGAQLVADGVVGPRTVAALNAHPHQALLLKAFAFLRGTFYIGLAEKSLTQEQFIPSWFLRISLS
ncbi:glycoside hydrolase family 108 protein [Hymenobacter ruricola]|uniref:Peptidoglycan-binding protein n=1 Tax=Hymenobacter ruricola TaxID=2791023 RepID=A0ABS0I904_9BACT|nr:glycosyl hydrolase 108 family protein [Hymenobacter ruricola]MBF9223004.1 hypothetical protein [Hymenobacter ruricola]